MKIGQAGLFISLSKRSISATLILVMESKMGLFALRNEVFLNDYYKVNLINMRVFFLNDYYKVNPIDQMAVVSLVKFTFSAILMAY